MGHDLPRFWRNAGNFEVIDAVLKSTPDVEAEVESRDPKLMRWKVVWKVAQTAEVPAGQFGYQVMLQQTDKNKDCWGECFNLLCLSYIFDYFCILLYLSDFLFHDGMMWGDDFGFRDHFPSGGLTIFGPSQVMAKVTLQTETMETILREASWYLHIACMHACIHTYIHT